MQTTTQTPVKELIETPPMQPLEEMLLVLRDEAPETTVAGVFMGGDRNKRRPFTGTVICIGPASDEAPTRMDHLEPGDRILFNRHADNLLQVGDDQIGVIHIQDVVCKVLTDQEITHVDAR